MKQKLQLAKRMNGVLKSKRRLAMAIGILVLCAAAISAVAALGPAKGVWKTSARTAVMAQSGDVQATLRADGFTPSETNHTAGSFRLTVVNESGAQNLHLRLVKENGEVMREINITSGQQQWSETVELPGGGYYLTEANHAAWLFHITVQ